MTDPCALAREVIRQHGDLDRDALSRREKERLDLARAVERVSALADRLDLEAYEVLGRPVPSWASRRIRDALEGQDND